MPPSLPDITPQPAILIIGGSDSSNGAGIGRDIQTAHQHDITPLVAITAVTAQTHDKLLHKEDMSKTCVTRQIGAAFDSSSHRIMAVKIGLVPNATILRAIATELSQIHVPIVMDPVMSTSSGGNFHDDTVSFIDAVKEFMPSLVTLLTPNRHEATLLTGDTNDAVIDKTLMTQGWQNVLITNGDSMTDTVCDRLINSGGQTSHTHAKINAPIYALRGTGCRLATAIAIRLALGDSLTHSIDRSRRWLLDCLRAAAPPHANPA